MSKLTKVTFKLLDLLIIFVMVFGSPMSALADPSPTGATITTQLPDYPPGAIILMTGAGWAPDESVHIVVNADDQSWTLESNPDPVADSAGGFTYEFQLPDWFVASYTVSATGFTSGTATVTFTDLAIGTYDQCANDDGDGYDGDPGTCSWTNGNLQSNNSTYNEGDATVQRLWLTDLVPGSTHSVTLKYGTTKGGKHAYDYLTTWNWSENWITLDDLCKAPQGQGLIQGCNTASQMTFGIPDDPNAPNSIEPIGGPGRLMAIAGGTITAISTPQIVFGDYNGDSETTITVSYTVGPNNGALCSTKGQTTTCGVMFWFGAHVAMTAQWMAYNGTGGAATISGSPYHVALEAVDGASVGQRDNQMQSNAVPLNGTITIIKDAIPDDAQDFNFNITNGGTFSQNFSLDDDADPALPNSKSFSLPAGTYTAAELGSYLGWTFTNLACTVTGSNGSTTVVDLDNAQATINLVTGFDTSDTVTCTFTNTKGLALSATKTANGSFNRTVTWELTKSVDPDSHSGYAGQSFDSTWTVVATKTEVPGNFKVVGSITINNSNNYAVPVTVSDTLSDGTVATVSCPANSVPANGSLVCTYEAYPTDGSATSNTATITSGDPNVGGTSASADITWIEGPPTGYDSGDLTDPRFAGPPWNYAGETISASTTKYFDETFTCPIDASLYVNGLYQFTEENTAYLNSGINLQASADVDVTCYLQPLVPTKTAAGEWDRTVTWTLTKTVDDDSHSGNAGDTFNSTWTVVADKTDSGPMNFVVTGTISVYNPSAIAQTFSVTDELNDLAGTNATVSCPSNTVAAGDTVVCTYTASPSGSTATLNTATISAVGNADQTATDPIEWAENLTGYDSGDLSDERFGYSETISGDTTENFPDEFACSTNPADYTNGSYSYTVTNTAVLDSNIGLEASDTVTVNCYRATLTIVKNVVNDNGGTATVSAFGVNTNAGSLTFDGGTANGTTTTYTSQTRVVLPGTYTLKESDVYGYTEGTWSCTGVAGAVVPTFNNGSVQVGKGEGVVCTITNDDQPGTIIIKKIVKPTTSQTSFSFDATGTGYNDFSLSDQQTNTQILNAGSYSVMEMVPLGWVLTGIGGSTDPLTPYNCTVSGSGGSTGVGDLNTQTATISLKNGDTVTCVFENTGQGATRTQGFWATHSQLANIAWFGGSGFGHTFPGVAATAGIGDRLICGRPIDDLGKLMGGFWSDISKKSNQSRRSSLDQARMQLLQQLLAAELNASAFGSVPTGGTGMFAQWEAALCGNSQTAITTAKQQAASFNTFGDSTTFTPGTSADSRYGRSIANIPFWDIIKP